MLLVAAPARAATPAAGAADPAAGSGAVAGKTDWFAMASREFRAAEAPGRPLDFKALDPDLLSAALLHETNVRRAKRGLPALRYDPKAREAAAMLARAMAAEQFVGHTHPTDPSMREMGDRVRLAGLTPSFVAENAGFSFGWRYEAGKSFFTSETNGTRVFRYEENGPPIKRHTYLSLAESFLDAWMKSSGHRANILDPRSRSLGCAVFLGLKDDDMEAFYGVQIFYTPLDDADRPASGR